MRIFLKPMRLLLPNFTILYIPLKKLKYRFLSIRHNIPVQEIFQTASTTELNRHPDLFTSLKRLRKDINLHILSFGCSTGEECLTLREYFPNAKIIGADVNRESLKKAINNTNDPGIKYILSKSETIRNFGKYDIILALSVLCKNPEGEYLNDISKVYPFRQYEKTVNFFDSILKPGGLMVIRSSNFRFSDTEISSRYKIIKDCGLRAPTLFPKFDKENRRLADYRDGDEIFIKLV